MYLYINTDRFSHKRVFVSSVFQQFEGQDV